MNTGKDRTADLNVGSRLQEVVMFLAIVAFFCVVLYGIYRLVKANDGDGQPAKVEIIQLGTPQRIGDGTLNLRSLLSDREVAVKNQITYSICTKTADGIIHFLDIRAIDVKFIDASGIRLEAEVKEPLGLDVFDYIEKNMGRAQYSWARPNDKVSVRLCCPMDSVEFYLKRGNGAK
jgi:hypothetical protein